MSTFNVTLKRTVNTIERKSVTVEAEDQLAASRAALEAVSDGDAAGWSETDALEAEIGEPEVEAVKIHAFDEEAAAAE